MIQYQRRKNKTKERIHRIISKSQKEKENNEKTQNGFISLQFSAIVEERHIEIGLFEYSYILFCENSKQSIKVQRTRQNPFKKPKYPSEVRH